MALLDPDARIQRGIATQCEVLAEASGDPATLFESSWRDYVFAEVWNRPGLDLRSRYLISIASASTVESPGDILDGYIRGALTRKELTLEELREGALHLAIYGGWSRGAVMDRAISRVAGALGLSSEFALLRAQPWDPATRLADGAAGFKEVMTFGGPPPATAYFEGGILNFVFGEAWNRPGLDQRGRRWITLVGVADSSSDTPIRSHIYGAMASGNASYQEMDEFVLQYAIHSGWPRASVIQGVVLAMAQNLKNRLTWDGKPLDEGTA
jgi:4-carboxymuconolactone decarboxylase